MSKKKNKFESKRSNQGFWEGTPVNNKIVVPIKGMHCRSCEILIGEKLEELPEVKNAQVSYKKSQAIVYLRQPLNMQVVEAAVRDAGYEVGVDDSKDWITKDPEKYKDLGVAFIVLLVLYFLAKQLGLSSLNVGTSNGNPSSLLVVLIVGLTAGISTCMALVGGLVLGISARHSEKHPEATPAQKFRPHIFFNIGRIASYFVLGGVVGLIGKAFQLSGTSLGILTILVGFVMLMLGAQLTELFPRLSNGGLTLPSGISKMLGIKKSHEKEYSHANSMLTGALTFFLPCGFTQAMQLYAMSTGSFIKGALILGVFAIGTAPGLLSVGGLTSVIKGAFAKKFFKFAGLLVVFLAMFNMANGWNLTGWRLPNLLQNYKSNETTNSTNNANDPNVTLENGIQIVRMTQDSNGYSPNKFTIQKGIPVKWIVNSVDSRTCAASIFASSIGVRKSLKLGENVIEFTPKETGQIKFSCSMGMYRGYFDVTEATPSVSEASPSPLAVSSPTPGSSPSSAPTISTTPSPTPPKFELKQDSDSNYSAVQVVKTTFTKKNDITPSSFSVKSGTPVKFEVNVQDDGFGCMSTITIPGLVDQDNVQLLEKGKTLTFEFTPSEKGTYEITCAMGVPRGKIIVT